MERRTSPGAAPAQPQASMNSSQPAGTSTGGLLTARVAPFLTLPVQPKLQVGSVDDPLEREADMTADRVMAGVPVTGPLSRIAPPANGHLIRRDAPAAQPVSEEERREFEAMRADFFRAAGERMSEDILGSAGFAEGPGGTHARPTNPDEALRVTTRWGVTRDILIAGVPNLSASIQGRVAAGSHGSDTLAARQQSLIDAMTSAGQQAYQDAIARVRGEPFWRNHLDTTTIFIFPDLSGANRYAGYTQEGTERSPDGTISKAFVIHISKDALEAGNLDSVVANLIHELSHTLDVGNVIAPSLDPFLNELAELLADHPDIQALRQGAADADEARQTHVKRIKQILYEHTGYGEKEVFAHLQQLTHQPSVTVDGTQVSGSRYILSTVEGYVRALQRIGIRPRTLSNILDALGRRTDILYDRRIAATPQGSTARQRLVREKELARLTLSVARDLAQEELDATVQPKLEPGAAGDASLQRSVAGTVAGGPAPAAVHAVLRAPGRPLDAGARTVAELSFGRDFGHVRVHTDAAAARSAEQIRARAYTSGPHIAFASGQYAPHTPAGLRLLSHELSHVVQQTGQPGGSPVARWPWDEPVTLKKVLSPAAVQRDAHRELLKQINGYPMKDMLATFAAMASAGTLDGMIADIDAAEGVDRPRLKIAMDAARIKGRGTPATEAEISDLKTRMAARELPADQQAEVLSFLGAGTQPAAVPAATEAASTTPAAAAAPQTSFKTSSYALSKTPVTVVKENKDEGLKEIREAPADYAARILVMAGLDSATWFSSFTSIKFLGQSVANIHTDLATHLKAVEARFAESHGGPSKDPAVAGTALGLNQGIGGAREAPTGTAFSMHLFGLAIDVNYTSNPWVGASANKVFANAGWLAVGKKLQYSGGMSYDQLSELDKAVETYFGYLDNIEALGARLAAIEDASNPWKGKSAEAAAKQIQQDLDTAATKWERTGAKDVIKKGGFLSLPKDFVDGIGLSWGASYGDIMHFDMRNKGSGRKIQSAIGAYKKKKQEEAKTE